MDEKDEALFANADRIWQLMQFIGAGQAARTPDPAADESDIALIGIMRAMRDHELSPRKKAKDMTREELLIECDRLRNICWDRRGAIQGLQAELQAARTPDPARLLAAAESMDVWRRDDGTWSAILQDDPSIQVIKPTLAEALTAIVEAAAKGGVS